MTPFLLQWQFPFPRSYFIKRVLWKLARHVSCVLVLTKEQCFAIKLRLKLDKLAT